MKIELNIIIDAFIDKEEYPHISPEKLVDSIIIRNSDVFDGFEITTKIDGLDETKDFFLNSAKIKTKKLVSNTYYFLVHRKFSDTWHVGYANETTSGMLGLFPASVPVTYKCKQDAFEGMKKCIRDQNEGIPLENVYEIDRLFDKEKAVTFVKQILKDKAEEALI